MPDAPDSPDRELVDLSRDQCVEFLGLELVGRIAFSPPDGAPLVVPVNYVMDGHSPVFRTHPGDRLIQLAGTTVTFQVDRFDWSHRTGWSVLVHGEAQVLGPDESATFDIETWAPGEKAAVIRIRADVITGRQIELHQLPLDGRAYL